MDIQVWQQLLEIKTNILEVACHLIEDRMASREEAALDLVVLCQSLSHLEEACVTSIRKNAIPRLESRVENSRKSNAQLHKDTPTTANSEGV